MNLIERLDSKTKLKDVIHLTEIPSAFQRTIESLNKMKKAWQR